MPSYLGMLSESDRGSIQGMGGENAREARTPPAIRERIPVAVIVRSVPAELRQRGTIRGALRWTGCAESSD